MLKDLFKGSLIYGLAPFLPKVLTIFLLPVLTRYLTSVDYGIIGTITSITFAVQALQDMGLRVVLAPYFYKCKTQYKVIWREIYGFLSLWMIVYALIQAILLYLFIPKEAESNKWLIIILSNFSTVFFGPTAMLGQTYYQLHLKPTPVALRVVIAGVTTILANFICVVVFRWGYMGAYVGTFAGTFFTNLSYWPVVNKKLGLSPIYNFKWTTIRSLLKVGIPTIPHYYTAYLMNASNIAAMNFHGKPQAVIGHLTMSQNISSIFEAIANAINQMFTPMSFRLIRDNKPFEMRRLMFTYLLIVYTLTTLYSLWAREAYDILISNEEIAATYKYSIILVMALNYRPLYVYCCNYFFYHQHTLQLLGITLAAGVICCVFYFTMIPYMGIYAALIGFFIGCMYHGYSGYFFKYYRIHTIYKIKWWIFPPLQIVLTLCTYYAVDLNVLTKVVISLIFLSIVWMLFRKKVEIQFPYKLIKKK